MKINISDIFIFLLGFLSSFQLLEIGGVALFSWILLLIAFKSVTGCRIRMEEKKIYLLLASISISQFMSLFIKVSNATQWQITSWKAFILFIAVILTYNYLREGERRSFFLWGVYCSGIVEVLWCYMQYVLYRGFGINLNELIFVKMLGLWSSRELHSYNTNGRFMLTGLNTNSGILPPALLFVCIISKKPIIKMAVVLIFFISGNSSMVICGITLLFMYVLLNIRTLVSLLLGRIKPELLLSIVFVAVVSIGVLLINDTLFSAAKEGIDTLLLRLNAARMGVGLDGSTLTHLRYYTSIPNLMSELNIFNIMFGFGLSCAGIPFAVYYKQYVSMVYVPESDPITYLYNIGILGFILFYLLLIKAIAQSFYIDKKYVLFFITIIITGFFYGIQLNWVILVEFLFIDGIRRKEKIDDLMSREISVSAK